MLFEVNITPWYEQMGMGQFACTLHALMLTLYDFLTSHFYTIMTQCVNATVDLLKIQYYVEDMKFLQERSYEDFMICFSIRSLPGLQIVVQAILQSVPG